MAIPVSPTPSTTAARRRKPAPQNTAGTILALQRCPELTRTDRGYERCHLDQHGPEVRHHVRDRSWRTDALTPCLQLGQPCGEACKWPDQVAPYLWYAASANAATVTAVRARPARKPGRPPRAPTSVSDTGRRAGRMT
jgi:hypothetical protein